MLFQGPIEHRLHPIRSAPSSVLSNNSIKPSLFSHHVTTNIWHYRLGYPSSTLQQAILSTVSCSNKHVQSVCSSCRLGKSSKLPFSLSTSISHKPLDLIHCDVWGPSPVSSISGYRFDVIFIGDCTRCCWIYPLCFKSEVFQTFCM